MRHLRMLASVVTLGALLVPAAAAPSAGAKPFKFSYKITAIAVTANVSQSDYEGNEVKAVTKLRLAKPVKGVYAYDAAHVMHALAHRDPRNISLVGEGTYSGSPSCAAEQTFQVVSRLETVALRAVNRSGSRIDVLVPRFPVLSPTDQVCGTPNVWIDGTATIPSSATKKKTFAVKIRRKEKVGQTVFTFLDYTINMTFQRTGS